MVDIFFYEICLVTIYRELEKNFFFSYVYDEKFCENELSKRYYFHLVIQYFKIDNFFSIRSIFVHKLPFIDFIDSIYFVLTK